MQKSGISSFAQKRIPAGKSTEREGLPAETSRWLYLQQWSSMYRCRDYSCKLYARLSIDIDDCDILFYILMPRV